MTDNMNSVLIVKKEDGIGTIFINRPEASNALLSSMLEKFINTLTQWADDDSIRVVIISAAGDRVFCVGGDAKEIMGPKQPETELEKVQMLNRDMAMCTLMHNVAYRIENCPQPVIVAINGAAFATGMMIALSGDIRIAADTVVFSGFTRFKVEGGWKTFLAPNFQYAQRLINLVGLSRATEIILMGTPVDAQTGRTIGLFNMVVPLGDLIPTAHDVAHKLMAQYTPTALRAVKPIMQQVMSYQTPTVVAKARAKELLSRCYGTEDFIEFSKLWLGEQHAVTSTKGEQVRFPHYVDDTTPAAVQRALETFRSS